MMGFGFGGLGMILVLLFWVGLVALIVWGVVYVANRSAQSSTDSNPKNKALAILRERYARGEIGKAEFEEMRRDLLA